MNNNKKTAIFTKTALSLILSFSITICNTPYCAASAADKYIYRHTNGFIPVTSNINSTNKDTGTDENTHTQTGVSVLAKSAVLIENNSGRILFEKEKDTELIPASITKIMTLLLVFEALHKIGRASCRERV